MARAAEIFAGATLTIADERKEYGEPRFHHDRPPRLPHGRERLDPARRGPPYHQLEANDREQALYRDRLD
jgi:hypothetical protein